MGHYVGDQTQLVGGLRCSLLLKPNYKLHLVPLQEYWFHKCFRISLNIRIINWSFANMEIFRPHLYTLILYLTVDSPDNCTFNKPCQVRLSGQIDSVLKYDREGQVLFDSAPFQLQH